MSGPALEVRALPRPISTFAERESLSRLEIPQPTGTTRVALWCSDMAKVFLQRGEFDRAEEWSRRGFRVGAPVLESALLTSLSVSSYKRGRPDEAARAAARALRLQPRNAMLHYYHGLALHEMARFAEALAAYRASLSLREEPRVHVNAARALAALGRTDEAFAELERVPANDPARPVALHDMAMILMVEMRRPREAAALMREALALDPNVEGAEAMRRALREMGESAP